MSTEMTTFCTFRTAGRWFGAPIEDVKEVNRQATTTRIPHAPPEVAGYVNIRGHIFLALDIAQMLGLEKSNQAERHLILFKSNVGPSFGIVVDEIGDITTVEAKEIDQLGSAGGPLNGNETIELTDLAIKVCRCAEELLIILDPKRFLKIVEQAMAGIE